MCCRLIDALTLNPKSSKQVNKRTSQFHIKSTSSATTLGGDCLKVRGERCRCFRHFRRSALSGYCNEKKNKMIRLAFKMKCKQCKIKNVEELYTENWSKHRLKQWTVLLTSFQHAWGQIPHWSSQMAACGSQTHPPSTSCSYSLPPV